MTLEQRLQMLLETHERLSVTLFQGGIASTIAATLEVLRIEIEELEKDVRSQTSN